MSDFLPPLVLPIDGAIGDLITALAESRAAIQAWAKSLPDATANLEPAMTSEGHAAGAAFANGLREEAKAVVPRVARDVSDRFRDERGRFARAGEEAADRFGSGFVGRLRAWLHRLTEDRSSLQSLRDTLSGLGTALMRTVIPFGPFGSLIAAAVGALAPLAGTLGQSLHLIALLPTAIAGAVMAVGALVAALHGVGTAIGFGLAGKTEKYAEALKKLAPAARDTVKAIVGLKPQLKDLQLTVQDRFFQHMATDIKAMASTYLPMLRTELTAVAGGFNSMLRETFALTQADGYIDSVRESLKNLRVGILNASHALVGFVSGFNDLINVGSRFAPEMGKWFGGLGDRFAAAMGNAASSGAMQQWMQSGLDALKQIIPLLKDAWSLVTSLLKAMTQMGGSATGVIGQLLHDLAQFAKSAEGMSGLVSMFQILGQFAGFFSGSIMALLPLVFSLVKALEPLTGALFAGLTTAVQTLAGALSPVLEALKPFIDALGQVIQMDMTGLNAVLSALASVLSETLVQALNALLPLMQELLPQFVSMAQEILPETLPLIKSLGELFLALMPALVPLVALWVDILVPALRVATPVLIFVVQALTALVRAVTAVVAPVAKAAGWFYKLVDSASTWKAVGGWFKDVWHTITHAFSVGIDWIKSAPGKIWEALKKLPGILAHAANEGIHKFVYYVFYGIGTVLKLWRDLPPKIWKFVKDLWSTVVEYTAKGIAEAWTWIKGLPERIGKAFGEMKDKSASTMSSWWHNTIQWFKDIGPKAWEFIKHLPEKIGEAVAGAGKWLYNAGRDVVNGLIEGMGSMLGAAVDWVKGLGHDMVKGFKDAIGAHSPARAFVAEGANIVSGVVVGVRSNAYRAVDATRAMIGGVTGLHGGAAAGLAAAGRAAAGGGYAPIVVNLGGKHLATIHAQLIPVAQRYKLRAGTTGLT